jgi:hypothetical protein
MPFIRLQTKGSSAVGRAIRFLDEQNREQVVPLLRLRAAILIGKDPPASSPDRRPDYSAVLDTGSPLTVFPKWAWREFASQVVRLQLVGEQAPVGRAGGRQFRYFLGRVWVGAFDPFDRRLPAVPVLAQFREDDIPAGEPRPPILLGLWGGILDGRTLTRWPTAERYDSDILTLESFGQWWRLADP